MAWKDVLGLTLRLTQPTTTAGAAPPHDREIRHRRKGARARGPHRGRPPRPRRRHQRPVARGDAPAQSRRAVVRGRHGDLGGDPHRQRPRLLRRLRPQGRGRPHAGQAGAWRAARLAAGRPAHVPRLVGHGAGDDRGHRGALHRRRRGARRLARFPLLRRERPLPHPRGGARHEHELGLAAAPAGADGAGAHQAGRDPRRRPHRLGGGARVGAGREGRRRRSSCARGDGLRGAHSRFAASAGHHDQDQHQPALGRARRSRRPHGYRPVRAAPPRARTTPRASPPSCSAASPASAGGDAPAQRRTSRAIPPAADQPLGEARDSRGRGRREG